MKKVKRTMKIPPLKYKKRDSPELVDIDAVNTAPEISKNMYKQKNPVPGMKGYRAK